MAGFRMRKNQRFKESVPVLYRGAQTAGEGMLTDLSLSGGAVKGNEPVSVGMRLRLRILAPGDSEPLLLDRAIVRWVKGLEFGIEFDQPPATVQAGLLRKIATLVQLQHGATSRRRPHDP